jgi:hypothetical protein
MTFGRAGRNSLVLLVEIQIMSGVVNAECNLNYKHNSTPRYTATTWGRIAPVHFYRDRIFNCKTKQFNFLWLLFHGLLSQL